jgi:hypothetical protein
MPRSSNTRCCDFCGKPESLPSRQLEMDEDDLWVCSECKARLTSKPTASVEDADLDEKLKPLIGKSAGAICYTLNLPYVPPYLYVIDAATNIAYDQDRYMSAWSFVTQRLDGTTVWLSEDRRARAIVSPEGTIQIVRRE